MVFSFIRCGCCGVFFHRGSRNNCTYCLCGFKMVVEEVEAFTNSTDEGFVRVFDKVQVVKELVDRENGFAQFPSGWREDAPVVHIPEHQLKCQ